MNFLFASILFLSTLFGNGLTDAQVDARVASYPKFTSATELSNRIKSDFSTDQNRARATFTYLATRVTYDLAEARNGSRIAYRFSSEADRIKKEFEFREKLVKKTLTSQKAVCEGYASVFVEVCRQMGIEAVIVPGTSRTHPSQIGKLPTWQDHAWNAVKIGGKWHLIDVTWAAGSIDTRSGKFKKEFNDVYFMMSPVDFFRTHFPDDSRWSMVNGTAEDFSAAPFYYPTYFKNGYKVNLQQGTLKINRPMLVEISIDGLRAGEKVYYTIGSQTTLQPLAARDGTVQIPVNGKTGGHLTIFVGLKPIVAYKLVR